MAELTLVCIVAGGVSRPARLGSIEAPVGTNGLIDLCGINQCRIAIAAFGQIPRSDFPKTQSKSLDSLGQVCYSWESSLRLAKSRQV
jgi:hypothetical protein